MHGTPSPHRLPAAFALPTRTRSRRGFSLIEVTLAIGIIAFAFVALFGLLPTGLNTFRASVDSTNDVTMMQAMNTMIQVTAWKNIDNLDHQRGGDIYYFDEEARRTDTKKHVSTDAAVVNRRLYQVKLLVEPFYQPGTKGRSASDELVDARRVIVIIGDVVQPKSTADFESVKTSTDLQRKERSFSVRSRSFIVSRMESATGE